MYVLLPVQDAERVVDEDVSGESEAERDRKRPRIEIEYETELQPPAKLKAT